MKKKVSVIIPMYNAERTIKECLDSLVNQTMFEDMELLIVDDCSNDMCSGIVMEYELEYPDNILFIRLDTNAGPGNARNIAMEYVSGDYIGFVDSDDAVQPTMYEKLYKEAVRTRADYVDSGFYDQKNDQAIVFVSDELAGTLDDAKRSSLIAVGGYIVTKIFRRDFIDLNNIRFRNEYVLEDMDFLIECTARARKIATVKEIMYVYRNSSGSLSKTDQSLKYIHNQSSAMLAIYERAHGLENYEGIREAVEFAMLHLYSNILNVCTNLVYLQIQPEDTVVSIMNSLKKLKDNVVLGNYDSEYIRKGISKTNLDIIKANDISPEAVLRNMRREEN